MTGNIVRFGGRREAPVEQARPFIEDRCFDDLWGLRIDLRDALIQRQIVFLTEFPRQGQQYGGTIIASSWQHAEEIALSRGLGEVVVGLIGEAIPR